MVHHRLTQALTLRHQISIIHSRRSTSGHHSITITIGTTHIHHKRDMEILGLQGLVEDLVAMDRSFMVGFGFILLLNQVIDSLIYRWRNLQSNSSSGYQKFHGNGRNTAIGTSRRSRSSSGSIKTFGQRKFMRWARISPQQIHKFDFQSAFGRRERGRWRTF